MKGLTGYVLCSTQHARKTAASYTFRGCDVGARGTPCHAGSRRRQSREGDALPVARVSALASGEVEDKERGLHLGFLDTDRDARQMVARAALAQPLNDPVR